MSKDWAGHGISETPCILVVMPRTGGQTLPLDGLESLMETGRLRWHRARDVIRKNKQRALEDTPR